MYLEIGLHILVAINYSSVIDLFSMVPIFLHTALFF